MDSIMTSGGERRKRCNGRHKWENQIERQEKQKDEVDKQTIILFIVSNQIISDWDYNVGHMLLLSSIITTSIAGVLPIVLHNGF